MTRGHLCVCVCVCVCVCTNDERIQPASSLVLLSHHAPVVYYDFISLASFWVVDALAPQYFCSTRQSIASGYRLTLHDFAW